MTDRMNIFIKWMKTSGFYLSEKLSIDFKPESNFGVTANDSIAKDEVIVEIPKSCLLSLDNSDLKYKLSSDELQGSQWSQLILCILHEKYKSDSSFWHIYLLMFPNFNNCQLPLLWSDSEQDFLKSTGVTERIKSDNKHIMEDFQNYVLPVVKNHPELFGESELTLDKYKKEVAFVMAYSFTEQSNQLNHNSQSDEEDDEDTKTTMKYPPVMMPMADLLNHTSQHNACVMFHPEKLSIVALANISAGEQIWNTYGDLSNTTLLYMYGFCLCPASDNKDDSLEIDVGGELLLKHDQDMVSRVDTIRELRPDLLVIVADFNGLMNTMETAQLINVLCMSTQDFHSWQKEMENNDGDWEEISEQLECLADQMDCVDTLRGLPVQFKNVLRQIFQAQRHIKQEAVHKNLSGINSTTTISHSSVHFGPNQYRFIRELLEGHIAIIDNIIRHLN